MIDVQDKAKIKECFDFFDKMSVSSDKELSAVVSNKDYLPN